MGGCTSNEVGGISKYHLLLFAAGFKEVVEFLVESGADLDCVDVKGQTPLFVALVTQHWDCARYLLIKGANPNGSRRNLCAPIAVMAQRGYYEGVRV